MTKLPRMLEQSDAGFPRTRWSLIDAMVHGDDLQRQAALQELANTYWPAIYAFLRRQGKGREGAADLTQAFFTEVILQRKLFEFADPHRGSVKALLRQALKRFLVDNHRRQTAGPTRLQLSIEQLSQEDNGLGELTQIDPESLFERRWALAMLEEALRRCEQHYADTGKLKHWQAFEERIAKPCIMMQPPSSHEQIADQLGLSGPDESVALVRVVRKRLIGILHQIVAETTEDPAEQAAEYQDMVALLS